MLKIIADNKIPFLEGVLEPYAHISYLPGAKTDASVIKGADALITRTRTKCDEKALSDSGVKMIATATIGFDHIDTAYCDKNNIKWVNAPGCNSGSVLQYIAATIATLTSKLCIDATQQTIGIIGVGNVGSKVAGFANSIGMKVLQYDPPRAEKEGREQFVDLPELLAQADLITFHVPLQRTGIYKTHHLGDAAFFEQCKKNAIIINSSRGEVINNDDLLAALNKQTIGHAVLDVWENEPDINRGLLDKTMIATPHIAGYSADGKANGTSMSVQAISRRFGLPLEDWYPSNIPAPAHPTLQIDAQGMTDQQVWSKAILHTYEILEDDQRFRREPATFEYLRGSYPIRREFRAYCIQLKNGSERLVEMLNKIGFGHVELI
ncbi:4-phosphoerythronate dehydrogenase [Saccharicrinis fermentans]|uniref:Erythronate-4-phosphate dehydrogenase n=1 Tax=Saccharicrinis fermentans DSM 9555 = JCM 21142 TaxID=869213 RepID=W7Y1L6_9BACT|nr:4-phosphoerythronate dehydrogenase [Saccharicrinis fermentans]GAF01857.1 erythronate-4-phosphate dehydrogenase [Saccharicrinis fermentans DSM 9555 = JCM 21142]